MRDEKARHYCLLLLAPLVAAAQPKPVADLIRAIDQASSAEPAAAAIDTKIRAAAALRRFYPDHAKRFALDAIQILPQIRQPEIAEDLGHRALEALAQVDLEEASRAIRTMRGSDQDYVLLAAQWMEKDPKAAREFVGQALGAGNFPGSAAAMVFLHLARADPQEAQGLFAQMVNAFHAGSADVAGTMTLLHAVNKMASLNAPLALQAVDKIVEAVQSKSFRPRAGEGATFQANGSDVSLEGSREVVLFQVAAMTKAHAPEIFERYKDTFEKWRQQLEGVTQENLQQVVRPRSTRVGSPYSPRWIRESLLKPDATVPFADALAKARATPEIETRVPLLIDLVERTEAPPEQRATLASDALIQTGRMKVGARQYAAYGRLLSHFSEQRLLPQAVGAAQGMTRHVAANLRCADRECDPPGRRQPGVAAYQQIVERLRWNGVTLDELGVEDPSLRARYLVTDLDYLLHRMKP